jgi:hypothetical protein
MQRAIASGKKKRDSKPNPHWRAAAMASSPLLKENFGFLSFFFEGSTHRISLVALYIKQLSEKKMKVFVCVCVLENLEECTRKEERKSLFLSSSSCCVRGRKDAPISHREKVYLTVHF